MGRYTGDENQFAFLYESGTYAVASGAGQWMGLVTNNDTVNNMNRQRLRFANSSGRNVDMHVKTMEDFGGNFTMHPQDFRFLAFTLGSMTDSGVGPYTHTIKELGNAEQSQFASGTFCPFFSFSIEDHQEGPTKSFVRTNIGTMMDSVQYTVEEGGISEVSAAYVSQDSVPTSGAATAVTANEIRPFIWEDHQVVLGGTNVLALTRINFTVNNNIRRRHYLNGSAVTETPIPQNRDYLLELTVDGEQNQTNTWYNTYAVTGSEFNTVVIIEDTSAGAGSRVGSIILSGCTMDMAAPSPVEGIDEQTIQVVPKSATVVFTDIVAKYGAW